jgi:hypothetical protein
MKHRTATDLHAMGELSNFDDVRDLDPRRGHELERSRT